MCVYLWRGGRFFKIGFEIDYLGRRSVHWFLYIKETAVFCTGGSGAPRFVHPEPVPNSSQTCPMVEADDGNNTGNGKFAHLAAKFAHLTPSSCT